jgi:DNA-binding transcriptional ArsR family regulator
VAKHLSVLRDAGLVHAARRGRETQFEASHEPLDEVAQWMDAVGKAWDRRLERLARRVNR